MSNWNAFAEPIYAKFTINGSYDFNMVLAWRILYKQIGNILVEPQIAGIEYLTDSGATIENPDDIEWG